jgi:serine/threonine-protein phosphatase 2A regulatory subunit B
MDHEFTINSIAPVPDGSQFYTSDDLTVKMWCTEFPDTSVESYSLRKNSAEDTRERIRSSYIFPHEGCMCFLATSTGCVRVLDLRWSMQWGGRDAQVFANAPNPADGKFADITNCLSSCCLSPCGRYVAARDFMTVSVWDVRRASSALSTQPTTALVGRRELHSSLREHFDALYQSELLFERFAISFAGERHIVTGSFNNGVCVVDVLDPLDEKSLKCFQLVGQAGEYAPTLDAPCAGGSRVTHLTAAMKTGRGIEMGVSCGDAVTIVEFCP